MSSRFYNSAIVNTAKFDTLIVYLCRFFSSKMRRIKKSVKKILLFFLFFFFGSECLLVRGVFDYLK
jgi:hypothetical protein